MHYWFGKSYARITWINAETKLLGSNLIGHSFIVIRRSLGVSQLGVVVNKLDTVSWSKDRFDEIVAKLKIFLRQAGFKESDVTYIPCSGLTGENLVKPPTDEALLAWYNGPTLVSVIGRYPRNNNNKTKSLLNLNNLLSNCNFR